MKNIFKKLIIAILTLEARLVLAKYRPKVIAVTGNVGKTSTKDAIYAILSSSAFVRKSEKSYNSEIGVPLTILGVQNGWNNPFIWVKNIIEGFALLILPNHYPKWLVLEVGADRPGDIRSIARWLSPHIVVMTRVPNVPVHVEFFESPAAVVEEKSALIKALPVSGTLILNADDAHARTFRTHFRGQVRTYGAIAASNLSASHERITYDKNGLPTGMQFRVDYERTSVPITLRGALGIQHVYPALAALLVGATEGLNLVAMGAALSTYEPPPGRMRILSGVKHTVLIDDSYNSSPAAVELALQTLERVETRGRKIAVLGDMMELGTFSYDEHKRAGRRVAKVADLLLTVGIRARGIAKGALSAGLNEKNVLEYDDARRAGKELEHMLEEGDTVLIKGSQAVRLERVVEEVMTHPENREKLLVRQDRVWRTIP